MGEQGQAQGLAWEILTVSPCPGPCCSSWKSPWQHISCNQHPSRTWYSICSNKTAVPKCLVCPAKRHDTYINITRAKLWRCYLCVCWIWSEASITCPKYTKLWGQISKKCQKPSACLVFLEFSEQDVLSYSLLHTLPQQTFKRLINVETQYYRLLLGQVQAYHQDNLNS